jgi:hypothetical protein
MTTPTPFDVMAEYQPTRDKTREENAALYWALYIANGPRWRPRKARAILARARARLAPKEGTTP